MHAHERQLNNYGMRKPQCAWAARPIINDTPNIPKRDTTYVQHCENKYSIQSLALMRSATIYAYLNLTIEMKHAFARVVTDRHTGQLL